MLSSWHSSTACRAIAAKTPEWEFLSAFSRKSQLGASVSKMKTWGVVRDCLHKEKYKFMGHGVAGPGELWNLANAKGKGAGACYEAVKASSRCAQDYFTYATRGDQNCGCKDSSAPLSVRVDATADYYRIEPEALSTFETPDELKAHTPGRYLTSVLLISFLERIGLNSSATVQASKADVSSVKMTGHGFSKGWLTKCAPKDDSIVGACSVPPSLEAHKAGPYSINETVSVHCSPGFVGARKSWKLKCRDLHTWEVVPEKGAADASEARDKPACKAIFCKSPVDVLGVWLGTTGYNGTLRLKCADGYKPSNGPSSLLCLDGGHFRDFARCIAIGSTTGTWRRNVFLNGLFSLVGLAVVLVVVVAACWREPPTKVSTQRTEAQPLKERVAATMDME